MKAKDLIERLSRLPPETEVADVLLKSAPSGFSEPTFVPSWALRGDEADDFLGNALDETWHYPSPDEVLATPVPRGPFGVNVELDETHKPIVILQRLMAGGSGRVVLHFKIALTYDYVDPATKTCVVHRPTTNGFECVTVEISDLIHAAHQRVQFALKSLLLKHPGASRIALTLTPSQAGDVLSLPYERRPAFRVLNPPPLSAPVAAALKAAEECKTNAAVLAAYREAGGEAVNVLQVLGRLRGALVATTESRTLFDGAKHALRLARKRLRAAGHVDAADHLDHLSPEEVVSEFYR